MFCAVMGVPSEYVTSVRMLNVNTVASSLISGSSVAIQGSSSSVSGFW